MVIICVSTIISLSGYEIFNSKLYRFVSINNVNNKYFWLLHKRMVRLSIMVYLCFIVGGII